MFVSYGKMSGNALFSIFGMRSRPYLWLCLLAAVLLPAVAASLCWGASSITPGDIARAVLSGDAQSAAYRIFVHVRLPRTLAAVLCGSALAVAGLCLQAVLHNPLASPSVLGINAGAGLGALLVMALWPQAVALVPQAAFVGAALAALGVYALAKLTGASRSTIVLAGVALSSVLGAVMDAIVTLVPDAAVSRSSFAIGGFAGTTLRQLAMAAPLLVVGIVLCTLRSREMRMLQLGDEVAQGLGVRVRRERMVLLLAAGMLAGAAVSIAGLIGFVGLIVPHMVRMIFPYEGRYHLPACAVMGALLCVLCDMLARALFAPYELPVGVVLSCLGGPFFIYLLFRQRKRSNRHDAL